MPAIDMNATAMSDPRPPGAPLRLLRGVAYRSFVDQCDDGTLWRVGEPIACDWPVYLLIKLEYVEEEGILPHGHRWLATLSAVSPGFASDASILSAVHSWGLLDGDGIDDGTDDETLIAILCEALHDYGCRAVIAEKSSRRAHGPVKGCAVEAVGAQLMLGFMLDTQQNAIGNSGWDFLSGTAGFRPEPKRIDPTRATGLCGRPRPLTERETWLLARVNAIIPDRYAVEEE